MFHTTEEIILHKIILVVRGFLKLISSTFTKITLIYLKNIRKIYLIITNLLSQSKKSLRTKLWSGTYLKNNHYIKYITEQITEMYTTLHEDLRDMWIKNFKEILKEQIFIKKITFNNNYVALTESSSRKLN